MGNAYGESVVLVAAVKTQSSERINAAIKGGVDAIAENRVQEFREKTGIADCPRHFIGHLQTNKVKYLVGQVDLFHSCDRDALAEEISRLSLLKGVVSDVLVQVNIGMEATKGGYPPEQTLAAVERLSALKGLRVRGLMAMLPASENEAYLKELAQKMRVLFEQVRKKCENAVYLSMGMSGDYKLCVECGSNMVRLGSTIFGERK